VHRHRLHRSPRRGNDRRRARVRHSRYRPRHPAGIARDAVRAVPPAAERARLRVLRLRPRTFDLPQAGRSDARRAPGRDRIDRDPVLLHAGSSDRRIRRDALRLAPGMPTFLHVVGARPNFMKAAPVLAAGRARGVTQILVHTGQHYDQAMSDAFFEDLELPAPDENLGVGSGTHAEQTARIMLGFEPVLDRRKPDWVVVYGDVNSTVACALVAANN